MMEQDSSRGSKRGGYTSQSVVERRLTLNQGGLKS
jgi:hypothetical protein